MPGVNKQNSVIHGGGQSAAIEVGHKKTFCLDRTSV